MTQKNLRQKDYLIECLGGNKWFWCFRMNQNQRYISSITFIYKISWSIKVCRNNLELNYYYYVYLAIYSPEWNTGHGINRKRNCVFFWFQIGCMVSTWSWNCSHSWWFFDVRKECRLWIKRSQLLFSKLIPNQHNFHTSISKIL